MGDLLGYLHSHFLSEPVLDEAAATFAPHERAGSSRACCVALTRRLYLGAGA